MLGQLRSYFRGSSSVERIIACKLSRGRRLHVESLEARWLLSADVYHASYDGTFRPEFESEGGSGQFQFPDGQRWSTTATDGGGLGQGDPTTVTWSIVPDGTFIGASSFDANGGGPGNSDMIAFLDGIRGAGPGGADLTQRPWFTVFVDAFDRLSALSGLTFVYEANDDGVNHGSAAGSLGERGDIRIGGRLVDGEPMGGSTLGYNAAPNNGDMVIDTGNTNFYSGTANNSLGFRNLLMHEVGHGLGLDHVAPVDQTKLMEPSITTAFDGPQIDDILALHRGYGDALEKGGGNDSIADATPLGAMPAGSFKTIGRDGGPDTTVDPTNVDFVSIDDDSDEDFFRIDLAAGTLLNVFLTPLGPTYDQGPDGNPPPAPTAFDSSSQSDLAITLFDSGGGVLATQDVNGIGGNEQLNFSIATSGAYFVRITGDDNAVQLYQLDITTADRFEDNDTIATATILGSVPYITLQDLTIDTPDDEDFFKITAHSTGKLIVNAYFVDDAGDIDIQIQDRFGNVIASSSSTDDNEQIIIPVVGQEMYFLRVFGFGDDLNAYDLEIENFPAPFPSHIDLAASSDTGMMNNDDITSDTTPTFFIQADLANFQSMGITMLNQATIDPNGDGNADDATDDGAGVYVSLINLGTGALVEGFANPVGPTGILWTFTVPALAALTTGEWFVSTAVQIVDGQDTDNTVVGTQRATGRAQLSDPFLLTIIEPGGDVSAMVSADMIDASDTGMLDDDNVTNKMSPAFNGVAPVGSKVRLYANGELVGQTVAGSDTSDVGIGGVGGLGGAANDGMGLWEITSEPLADNGYDITLEIEDGAGNVTIVDPIFNPTMPEIDIVIDTLEPNTPLLDLIDDTGRHDHDNVTKDNSPRVTMTTTDPNIALAQLLFTDNLKFRIFDRFENGAEFLLYDSALDAAVDAVSTPGDMFTSLTFILETLPEQYFTLFGGAANPAVISVAGAGALADGVHQFKLEVEDRAGNLSHDFLLPIAVDTVTPPVSFGLPAAASAIDGLAASSDTGVTTMPATYADRVTSDTTPTIWGRAEANSIVRVYLDRNGDGVIDLATDTLLGQTVALPYDGNDAYPEGFWELTSQLDLNELVGLPKDGLRRLAVTAEDLAGNPMPMNGQIVDGVDQLQIFIDTQGPQVTGVEVNGFPDYDLFDPKPSTSGFTPLVHTLQIDFRDLPNRLDQVGPVNDFLYEALKEDIAANPGNYLLVGDHVGVIPIQSIVVTNDPRTNGNPATATVELHFFAPLPDDRYTLTISQNLVDPAGNNLDGEANTAEPQEDPTFPSGDGVPGGNFVARFTIDSRPEIGASIPQGILIDINGNFVWDPANGQIGGDSTHVDLSFELAAFENGQLITGGLSVHDLVVVGRFTAPGDANLPLRLFDQLASYGNYDGVFRWLIDFDSDGVVYGNGDPDGVDDLIVNQGLLPGFNSTARAGAIPVAGDFDRNPANGDEIGLYYAGIWALDTNHDYILDRVITSNLNGAPIVGDFDGDGFDDLAVFNNNQFFFDLTFNALLHNSASSNASITWGFPGVLDRPVAADMDQDGIDDIGLWVPRNGAQPNEIIAEWYFLVSGDFDETQRITGQVNTLNHPFSPIPFGTDIYAEFGHELALPIVGNFDPPVAPSVVPGDGMDGDYNHNSTVDLADYDKWHSTFGSTTDLAADGNSDNRVNAADYVFWRDRLGQSVAGSGTAAASASAATLTEEGYSDTGGDFVVDSGLLPFEFGAANISSNPSAYWPLASNNQSTTQSSQILLLEAIWSEPEVSELPSVTNEWDDKAFEESVPDVSSLDSAFAEILEELAA